MFEDNQIRRENYFSSYLYTTQELVLIALLAALGLGTKQIIGPVVKTFTSLLIIPGGAVAGGFYMLWLALGRGFIRKPLSATFIAVVQSLAVLILPFGSHGILTLITYTAPGIVIDILYFIITLIKNDPNVGLFDLCLYAGSANMTGTILSGLVNRMFEGLNPLIFVVYLSIAFFSGTMGGIIAYKIQQEYEAFILTDDLNEEDTEENQINGIESNQK